MKLKTPKLIKATFGIYLIISTLATAIFISLFFIGGYWRNYVSGPGEVIAQMSPIGTHNAFVTDAPSIDGPNQTMYIESADKKEFLEIGRLIEDVDYIKDIIWSDDGSQVVFWSKDYITLVNIEDYSSQRVYLGEPWERMEGSRGSTFSSGKSKDVELVRFEKNTLTYMLENEQKEIPLE